jgi:UDP-2-acetamido-2-deoxy-ribo-hexuluronate aminotransferase
VHYPLSLHQQPAYAAGYVGLSFPVSERLAGEVLSLPMHADLDEATQQRIVNAVRS